MTIKRTLSLFLACILLLGTFPIFALGENTDTLCLGAEAETEETAADREEESAFRGEELDAPNTAEPLFDSSEQEDIYEEPASDESIVSDKTEAGLEENAPAEDGDVNIADGTENTSPQDDAELADEPAAEAEQAKAAVSYPWDSEDDETFSAWVLEEDHAAYILRLLLEEGEELKAFHARIEGVEDAERRAELLAYIQSLQAAQAEGNTEEELAQQACIETEENNNTENSIEEGEALIDTQKPTESPFPGPDAAFSLSAEQKQIKEALAASGIAESLLKKKEGRDYTAGTLIFACNNQAYAKTVAAIYGADLKDCSFGVAKIELRSGTVAEAVALAADPENEYPPVEPEYIFAYIDNPEPLPLGSGDSSSQVPVSECWDSWVNSETRLLENPDLYLQDPSSAAYQWQHDMINTYEAWSVTTGKSSIVVAVIDSGVNTSHQDLHDVSTVNIGLGTNPQDSHATHVAGIIAATLGNGKGGAGIAPGVSILSIRVTENSGASNANLIKGINAAVSAGADIINISIGGTDHSALLENALLNAYNAGVTVIASAGNSGDNTEYYPAAYSTVIAVGSIEMTGRRAPSSTYGNWVDICAPGEYIISTIKGASGYGIMSGTSMASPMVAGVAALYMSRMGHVSPSKMRSVLLASVTKTPSSGMGAGIIDASKLFTADKTAPVFELNGTRVSGSVHAKVTDALSFTGLNSDGAILYTLDGTTPAIANGKVKNGSLCEDGYILIGDMGEVGTTRTVKAAFVNPIGVRSNIATIKITIDPSDTVEKIHIVAPAELQAGKSAKMAVYSEPKYSSAAVIWSISERNGAPNATLSADGILRTKSTDYGTVTLKAVSKVNSAVSAEAIVSVARIDLVTSISLPKSATLIYSANTSIQKQLTVKFKTKSGAIYYQAPTGSFEGIQAAWSSSDKKVVTVDEEGLLTPVGTGSAKVTCRALDGSGKSKTCTVKVVRGADSLSVKGNTAIAAGTSATYSAVFTPSNAANKAVLWSLENAPQGVSISGKGKLSVPLGVSEGEFTVCAAAKDGTGASGKMCVRIIPRVQSLKLESPDDTQGVRYSFSKGVLSTLTLYTVNLPGTERTENRVDLDYDCNGPEDSLVWTSSDTSIAEVDAEGVITARRKGTVTVCVQANDGSGKKASVKVYVKVPASTLHIVSGHTKIDPYIFPEYADGYSYIGAGSSVKNTVSVGDGFGTPNSSKVTWSIASIETSSGEDVTELWLRKKIASVSSSGILKINASAPSYFGGGGYAHLLLAAYRAEEGITATYDYIVIKKEQAFSVDYKTVYLFAQTGDELIYVQDVALTRETRFADCYTVSSSNPSIAGATLYWKRQASGKYEGTVEITPNRKCGTCYITIKANDGSGKTAKIKVIVF